MPQDLNYKAGASGFTDVENRLKRGNKLLFSRDSLCLRDLNGLVQLQTHRILVMWALDCAKSTLEWFEGKYPCEHRPAYCIEMCEAWAEGRVKMPEAKRAILDAHAVAKEIDNPAYACLCRAIGHAGATVHTGSHAMGLPVYELTAIVLRQGKDDFKKPVSRMIYHYHQRLLYWRENTDTLKREWAGFLSRDISPD